MVPEAHDRTKKQRPTMLTTDLSLRIYPSYERISRRFMEHPEEFVHSLAPGSNSLIATWDRGRAISDPKFRQKF